MTILGYLGPFPGSASAADLTHYGDACMSAGMQRPASGSIESGCGCWGPSLASADGITAVVEGKPGSARPTLTPDPSGSPAALVLAAYRASGPALVETLQGAFSLAIVDAPARRVVLAVDHMGIERLTYAAQGDGIVFSSSAERVAHFPAFRPKVRRQAVYAYLLHHMVPGPETIFEGVLKLPPGHLVVFENSRLKVRRYWTPSFASDPDTSFGELKKELAESLQRAVAAQEPGATTGAFLSGGLDSSTVCGVLSKVGAGPARTFSIGFGHPDYDELPYARIANRHFGCVSHEYVVRGADIAEALPLIARAYDEPFGNSSALPTYYCARMAREHGVDHLLAGDGGDELFAGNSRYAEQRIFEVYERAPRWLRRGILEPVLRGCPAPLAVWPIRKARGYVEKASMPLPRRLEAWNLVFSLGASQVLHPDFLASIDPAGPLERMDQVWSSTPSNEYLHRMLFYDWHYTLADNDLRKVQTMTAAAGVRVSYPMLHRDVVELSMRIPPSLMMPDGRLRDFYKRAMAGFLPEQIIQKKKHGFGLPFGLLLKESPELQGMVSESLDGLRARNIINPGFVDELVQQHGRVHASYYGVFVWVLVMLEQWLRAHQLDIR